MLDAPLSLAPGVVGALIFVFGTMVGSFLNVVVHRFPTGSSIVWPGSRCPHCATPIRYWQNIPVLSFLLLRGRCASCRNAISVRYPLTELATGALFYAAFQRFGLGGETVLLWSFIGLLVSIFWIDWDTLSIYDHFTFPGVVLGLLYSYFFRDQLFSALAGMCAAVAILLVLNSCTLWLAEVDGLGDGDLTLVAMLGAWLGLTSVTIALVLSLFLASAMGLALLFFGWARQGIWSPHGVAVALSSAVFLAFCGLSGWPEWSSGFWYGAHLAWDTWLTVFAMALLLGGGVGWAYMRVTRDEGRLVMPFGPALSLAGVVTMFQGSSLQSYFETLMLGVTVG